MRWCGIWRVWGRVEMHTELWWGNMRERDYVKDLGIDGRVLLKWIFKKYDGDLDWVDLAQDRDRWRAVVSAVVNLRAP
jgi:hypothetical protein